MFFDVRYFKIDSSNMARTRKDERSLLYNKSQITKIPNVSFLMINSYVLLCHYRSFVIFQSTSILRVFEHNTVCGAVRKKVKP